MPDALNTVDSAPAAASRRPGDVPEAVRRRYLTEEREGPGVGFYHDARDPSPAFRDHGGRLATDRSDPHVVRDLVAIAQHRGWTTISVRGQTAFRREVYLLAHAAGLEVRGYRPTQRDRQHAERARDTRTPALTPAAADRLRIVETVVRNRVVEPAEQNRILEAARARLAQWLERGASFVEPDRGRRRDISR
jgi:hypothetical protein